MSNYKSILVGAWGALGDGLHGYSAACCFKAKNPDAKVVFACNHNWLPLMERSQALDAAIDIRTVSAETKRFDEVHWWAYDIDEKWKADEILEGYWGPTGWQRIVDSGFKYGFVFEPWEVEFVIERLKRAENKKIILVNTRFTQPDVDGASINNLRNLSLQKHLDIMKEAANRRNDIMFVRYLGHKEPDQESIDCDHIIDVGKEFGILGQSIMMCLSDFMISVQSGVHNLAQCMELPRIMLVPCRDDNQTGYSHPDACANPAQNQRYLFSNHTSGDICSYIKPRKGARTLNSIWANFWYKKHRTFPYRLLEDIEIKDVCDELDRRLDNPNAIGRDMFFEGIPMCLHCEMRVDFKGKCPLYQYPPVLRSGRIPGQEEGTLKDLNLSCFDADGNWVKFWP